MDQSVRNAPVLTATIKSAIQNMGFFHNPYFETLRNGHMSLGQFRKSQEQYFYTVDFFPRTLSALIARLTNGRDRLAVLQTMVLDYDNPQSVDFPASEFKIFLKSLGSPVIDLENDLPKPEVKAFNNILAAAGAFDELETALACLGCITLVSYDIADLIKEAIIERGWIVRDNVRYYQREASTTQQNPEVLLSIIENCWNDPPKKGLILQGIELGLFSYDRLYRDLVEL